MNYLGIQNHLTDEVKLLKDSLDLSNEKLRLAQVSLRVYKEEKDLLDENKSVLKLSKEFIIDDLMDLSDFFRERMLDIEEKISITKKKINVEGIVSKAPIQILFFAFFLVGVTR